MSWKLAELRWRHDVGLYESRWEKESGSLPVERKRAIEVFERRGRRSRSLSPSGRPGNGNLAGVEKDLGLGEPLLPASPAARSPINSTTRRTTPPLQPDRARGFSCSSLLSLPRATSCPFKDTATATACQRPPLDCAPTLNDFAPACQHAVKFSRSSSRVPFPTAEQGQRIDPEPGHPYFLSDTQGHIVSRNSEELAPLLSHQDSGASSSEFAEKLPWPTSSELSQDEQFPDVGDCLRVKRDTLDPSVVEAFDNLLEFEGAVFELLNSVATEHLWDIQSPQNSSETRWASTVSKHRSTSLLIPFKKMSEQAYPSGDAAAAAVSGNAIDPGDAIGAKPQTPKRRMTPIYDDYQTAVAMIRSGTPGLPSPATPPALEAAVPKPDGDIVDLPKAPGRRISYSMTDVHRKLAEHVNDLQSASPHKDIFLKQSATTHIPFEGEGGRRVSIPVFPLPGRDSDEDNERLINRVEYASGETGDNPANIHLDDNSIPLHDMELAQVRTRTRGEPVHSQEIHASSADFEFADDLNGDIPGTTAPASSSARVSGNAPTDTSTIGQIVDQYGSIPAEEMAASFGSHSAVPFEDSSPRGFGLAEEHASPVLVHRPGSRSAADAGPPPSWPLPQPPVLPRRSSKRRNSSGMLSSPGTYGNTSGLLNTKLVNMSPLKATWPGLCKPDLSPADPSQLKQSRSSTDLDSARGVEFDTSDRYGESGLAVTRLSHVTEESSSKSPRMPAERYVDKRPEAHQGRDSAYRFVEVGRRVDDVAYHPSEVCEGRARHRHGKKFGAGTRFGSLDHVLVAKADTDSDTIDVGDDADWETIHESGSNINLRTVDAQRNELSMSGPAESPTADSLSLKKAPVSTWDPLSNKTPGFEQSEIKMEELLKSYKKSAQNVQVDEMADTGANKSKMPNLVAQVKQPISLPGHINVGRRGPEASSLSPPKVSKANTPKTAAHLYIHPTPLQTEHKHPFTAARPILHPLTTTHSTSSTDSMADQIFNLRNRNIESTSSLAGGSAATVSIASGDDRHRAIQREIDLYDPDRPRVRKTFPNARLTIDKRVCEGRFDPEVVRVERILGRLFLVSAAITYVIGGFVLMNDMANGGGNYANGAMLQISRFFGMRRVVGALHAEDIRLAKKLETWLLWWMFVCVAVCFAVVAWAIYRIAKS